MFKLFGMKLFLPILLLLVSLAIIPVLDEYYYPVYAQDSATSSTRPIKDKLKQRRDNLQEEAGQKRENLEARLVAKQDRLEEKLTNREERIATKTAALKNRLKAFKDKQKAQRVETINENLEEINSRRTQTMGNHLDKMIQILNRLETRVETSASEADLTAVTSAIADARSAIGKAKSAITAQADKDYIITVNKEATVKEDAMLQRDNLHQDLKAVHELVVTARKAVSNAISTTVSTLKGASQTNGQ